MKKGLSVLLVLSLLLGVSFAKNSAEAVGAKKIEISGELSNVTQASPKVNTKSDRQHYVNNYKDSTLRVMYGVTDKLDLGIEHTGRYVQAWQNNKPSEFKPIGFTGAYNFVAKFDLGKVCPLADTTAIQYKGTLVPSEIFISTPSKDDFGSKFYTNSITLLASKKIAAKTTLGWGLGLMETKAIRTQEEGLFTAYAEPLAAATYTIGVDQEISEALTAYLTLSGKVNSYKVGQKVKDTTLFHEALDKKVVLQEDSFATLTFGLKYTI